MRRATVAAVVAALVLLAAPAAAIPSEGAGPDTPGTGASSSPGSLQAGQTLSYRVSGFPAGEIVYLKIDDGLFCSESGVHGACVVAQQRIPASGTVTGSLVLPSDLEPGKHWLRFLASEEVRGADGAYEGTKGYTARGHSDFTVVASSPATGSTTSAPSVGPTPSAVPDASGSTPSATGAGAGATLSVSPSGTQAALPEDTTTSGAAPIASTPVVRVQSTEETARFPYVGLAGLVVLCGLAGLLLLRARKPRG